MLIARLPDGSDVLFGISFDKEKKAFQARMRYRDPKGNKQIIRPSRWSIFDEQTHQHRKQMAIRRFQEFAKETGAKITKLEFGPNATNQQIIDAFSSSRAFDILTFDPKKAKAKKLA